MSEEVCQIQYVVSTLEETGPTRQLSNIISNIDGDIYDPYIVTLSPEPENSYKKVFEDMGVPVVSLGLSRLAGLAFAPSRLRSITENIGPDIIHTQGIRADSLIEHLFNSYPHVTTLRNYPPDDYIPRYGSLLGRLMVWQQFRLANNVDKAVACSETIREKYNAHGIDTITISNGVDAEKYSPPSARERREAREELEINPNSTVVVSVGGLIKRKDPLTVISGFQRSTMFDDSELFMLGDGGLMEKCQRVAGSSVHLPGHVNNVYKYLKVADVFISASLSEGLPNAVMEALATGVPVCLSNIGPHKEILSVNTDAGALFDTKDTDAVAEAIDSVARSDSVTREAARNIVNSELNAEIMAKHYESVYDMLAQAEN